MANDDQDTSQDTSRGLGGLANAFQKGYAQGGQKQKANKAKNTLKVADQTSRSQSVLSKAKTPANLSPTATPLSPPSFKRGGRVKRTGLALVHRGEYVIPAKHSSGRKASRKRAIIKA